MVWYALIGIWVDTLDWYCENGTGFPEETLEDWKSGCFCILSGAKIVNFWMGVELTIFSVSTSILTPPKSIVCEKMKDKIWWRIFFTSWIKVFRSTASSTAAEVGKNVRHEMVTSWRITRKEITLVQKNSAAWVFLDFVELNQFCKGTHRYSSRNRVRSTEVFLLIVLLHFGDRRIDCWVKPMYHLFASFIWFGLIRDVVAHPLIRAAPFSFHALKVDQTVKTRVEGQWKFRDYQGEVWFHKLKSFTHVGGYLTVKSNLAALSLNLWQQWLVFLILVETTAQAIQVLWNHGIIIELRKGVFIRETALVPTCPIMRKVSLRLKFKERVPLPRAIWKALIFFELLVHLPWAGLW